MDNSGRYGLSIELPSAQLQKAQHPNLAKANKIEPKKRKRLPGKQRLARIFMDLIDSLNKIEAKGNKSSSLNIGSCVVNGHSGKKPKIETDYHFDDQTTATFSFKAENSLNEFPHPNKITVESSLDKIRQTHLSVDFLASVSRLENNKRNLEIQTTRQFLKTDLPGIGNEATSPNKLPNCQHMSICYMIWNRRTGGFVSPIEIGKRMMLRRIEASNQKSTSHSTFMNQCVSQKHESDPRNDYNPLNSTLTEKRENKWCNKFIKSPNSCQ